MVMLTPTEKREPQRHKRRGVTREEEQTSQTKEETSTSCTRSMCKCQRKNLHPQFQAGHQFNRNEGELPELNRQVEKENGESRSSRGGAACNDSAPEVRTH